MSLPYCSHAAQPGTMMLSSQDQVDRLVVIYSRDAEFLGRRYPLKPSPAGITVGRHSGNTIVLGSDAVSRQHARFEQRGDGWWVVDSGSTHGTFVNEEQVQGALLHPGDRIRVGDTIFKVISAEEDARWIVETRYSWSTVDGLTKAYNRRYLIEQIDRELGAAGRTGRPLALVMFDLDHFKNINDTHGHLAGDQVLREIVALTQQHLRPGEVFARYGGEEFALLMPGADLRGAAALAEEIRAEVAAHVFAFEGQTSSMTISAGVAQADEDTRSADDLIRSADEQLYAAKRGGRNRVISGERLEDSTAPGQRAPVTGPAHVPEQPRIPDYWRNDDERPFLHKAFDHELGDADRTLYAKLVEEKDPERAEWLRLEMALHSRATDDPAVLARFIELARKIGLDYANLLLRDRILNCGSESAKRAAPRVRFAFACSKRWETLAPTDAESVRFCQQCKEHVYHCNTVTEAASRARAGQCIAIPKPLSERGVESDQLGRPDPLMAWVEHLFPPGTGS
jgi:two-component system, cell cycle response regulator